MKKTFILFTIITIFSTAFLLNSSKLHAQDDDVSKYMNDGGISSRSNYLTTNIFSIAFGDLAFQYGHYFGNQWAVEIGAGILLPYYNGSLIDPIDGNENVTANQGFSLSLRGKYFVFKDRESTNTSLLFRVRSFGEDVRYAFGVGMEETWFFADRFYLGLGMDMGITYKPEISAKDGQYIDPYETDLDQKVFGMFGAILKVGILF